MVSKVCFVLVIGPHYHIQNDYVDLQAKLSTSHFRIIRHCFCTAKWSNYVCDSQIVKPVNDTQIQTCFEKKSNQAKVDLCVMSDCSETTVCTKS